MADQLPDPLVPAEVDLRGMEFMPMKGDVLFKSTTWLKCSHEGRCAALRLWWHSFGHEVPAASLPNDDQLLAEYAGYGEVVKAWLKIKPQAMRGWVLCSDGRWYHKTVAELALEAWKGRVKNREKIRKWREKKAAENLSRIDTGNGNGTVSEPVTTPARNGREGERQTESQGQRERQLPKEEHEAPAAPTVASAPPPVSDDPGPIPDFLKRPKAEPELLPPEQPTDVKAIIFGAGLRWLRKACGDATESSCRSFLGQLIAQHGEAQTAACLISAEKTNPVDPRAWMKRNIGGPNGQQPRNPSRVQHRGESAEPDGISAAFARRSVLAGG